MIDLAKKISICNSQDTHMYEHLSKKFYKAWDSCDFGMRIKEGMGLFEGHLS